MRTEVNQTRINGKYPTDSVYYFGIAYPVREVDGYKVSTERLEARLEFDSPLLIEALPCPFRTKNTDDETMCKIVRRMHRKMKERINANEMK